MDFSQWAWLVKKIPWSGNTLTLYERNILATAVSKEGYADYESTHHYWFPWKRYNFLLQNSEANSSY